MFLRVVELFLPAHDSFSKRGLNRNEELKSYKLPLAASHHHTIGYLM